MWSLIARFLPSLAGGVSGMFNPWIIAAGMAAIGGAFFYGLHLGHQSLDVYIAKAEAVAQIQNAKNAAKVEKQKLFTETLTNVYQARIDSIQSHFTGWVPVNSAGRQVSRVSCPSAKPDGLAADLVSLTEYRELAGNCAKTTQQLISLQDWAKGISSSP